MTIPRFLEKKFLNMVSKYPVLTLTGPRQSGKTTLVKAALPDYKYFNLENPDTRDMAIDDPRMFLTQYSDSGVIIDEAQRVPEIFNYLQGIVDELGKMGRFVLTGSQNFLLLEKITQSLAGRVSINHLFPFSYDELMFIKNMNKLSVDELIFAGMYPAIYDRKINPLDYFPNYIQTYIERDVRSIKNIGDLNTFRKFLKLCAGRTGQLLNMTSLGNDLGIDMKTVKSWISILETSFIIFLLPPYHRNFNKRTVKHPKLYFYDTGLACSLLGLESADQLFSFYMKGSLFENFVISEYLKKEIHLGKRPAVYFWKDNTGNEVDLIIEKKGSFYAVEIKSGMTIKNDFFNGIEKFQKYSGIKSNYCFLVYGGENNHKRKAANIASWKSIDLLP